MRIGLLIVLGFLWSARLAAIKSAALSGIPLHVTIPVAIVGIGAVFTVVSAARGAWPPLDRQAIIFYLLSGVFGFVLPFVLENIVAPNLAVFLFMVIIATMPVITMLLAALLGLEKPGRRQTIAIGLGFLTAVLVAIDTRGTGPAIANSPVWALAAFSVPLVYAANTLFIASRWPRTPDTMHVAHAQSVIVGIVALLIGSATGGISEWGEASRNWPALLSIIGCEAVALLVYLKITRDHGASFVAQANYISMVFAALLGFILFGDHLSWLSVAAGVLLVAALHLGRKKAERPSSGV